jgi:hypothetical protein
MVRRPSDHSCTGVFICVLCVHLRPCLRLKASRVVSRRRLRFQMQDERGADETEAEPRGNDGDQHGGREGREHDERAAPGAATDLLRYQRGAGVGQHLPLEDVVRDVDGDEEPGVAVSRSSLMVRVSRGPTSCPEAPGTPPP